MEVLCLDVGDARIGVARANTIAKLPEPLVTVIVDGTEIGEIAKLLEEYRAEVLVVGMPRNMSGETTEQSEKVRAFSDRMAKSISQPIVFVDESVTTKRAEELLSQFAKRSSTADVDQMSAVVILEEYLAGL